MSRTKKSHFSPTKLILLQAYVQKVHTQITSMALLQMALHHDKAAKVTGKNREIDAEKEGDEKHRLSFSIALLAGFYLAANKTHFVLLLCAMDGKCWFCTQ